MNRIARTFCRMVAAAWSSSIAPGGLRAGSASDARPAPRADRVQHGEVLEPAKLRGGKSHRGPVQRLAEIPRAVQLPESDLVRIVVDHGAAANLPRGDRCEHQTRVAIANRRTVVVVVT